MELVPENLNGAVVFNLLNSCNANRAICGNCSDFAVAVHNWVLNTNVRYVLIDLQDEKEICPSFLEELLQLAKRVRFPFVFCGVMERAKRILSSYDFTTKSPVFVTPQEAIAFLEKTYPGVTRVSLEGVEFGVAIAQSRPRNALSLDEAGTEADAAD